MRGSRFVALVAALSSAGVTLLSACTDAASPTGVPSGADVAAADRAQASRLDDGLRHGRVFALRDDCEPTSFNAAVGPGTCVGDGRTTFAEFIRQLQTTQVARAWRIVPPHRAAKEGAVLVAVNRGGEEHTFTHVAQFGGGIVPNLNALSGNPVEAPECAALEPDDFIPPGGTYQLPTSGEEGSAARAHDDHGRGRHAHDQEPFKVQCCIHPWMRTTVRLHG